MSHRRRPNGLKSRASLEPFDLLLGLLTVWLATLADPTSEIRATLLLIAAAVVLWPTIGSRRARDRSSPAAERRRTRLIVLLALVSTTFAIGARLPGFATGWKVRAWNVYHYYLGAKYFPELGYTDLYDATLRADFEGDNYWRDLSRVRNLHTYEIEDRRFRLRLYNGYKDFDPERWRRFTEDVEALSVHRHPRDWRGIFTDRGYNGTPLWTVLGGALADLVPADHRLGLKLICSLDLMLLAATFGLIWATFGIRSAALVLLLLTASPVNLGRFIGGFLQYDWFCAVAAGVCFYRRRSYVLAAGGMAYATLTRIFPLLFVVAGVIPALASWWRTGRPPKRQLRFLAAYALWCALGFTASLWNGRGLDGWREFADGISLHREHHLLGQRRVGLQRLFTHDLQSFDLAAEGNRKQNAGRQRGEYALAAGVLLIFFLVVARRQRSWDAQLLGLIPIFALIVTSRYYWAYLALLPLIGGRRGPPDRKSRQLTGGQLLVLAGFYLYEARGFTTYATYGFFNLLLVGFWLFVLMICFSGSLSSQRAES